MYIYMCVRTYVFMYCILARDSRKPTKRKEDQWPHSGNVISEQRKLTRFSHRQHRTRFPISLCILRPTCPRQLPLSFYSFLFAGRLRWRAEVSTTGCKTKDPNDPIGSVVLDRLRSKLNSWLRLSGENDSSDVKHVSVSALCRGSFPETIRTR